MSDSTQDRRLPASSRKINKARREGQVARSRDLGHLAAVGAGGVLLVMLAPRLAAAAQQMLASGLRFDAGRLADAGVMSETLGNLALQMLVLVVPLGLAMLLAALAAGLLAGGWNFTLQPLAPKFGKMNPLAGIGRIFSRHQLTETLKACVLAGVLLAVGGAYLHAQMPGFSALAGMPLATALGASGSMLKGGLLLLLLALAVFALVDVPLQKLLLLQRLKMTREEAKKELKDVEGNLEVKGRIRARMRQMASRRMLAAVPDADLVVMNPTHYAVALKYDEAAMAAPRVVAKGTDLLALRIRDLAQSSGVPVLQAPPLARALYAHTEVDHEIPAQLFAAVAQVLAWVYQLRGMAAAAAAQVQPPQVAVPEGLDPAEPGALRRRNGRKAK